jgi:hypothetical protein
MILPISASQVARFTGVGFWHLTQMNTLAKNLVSWNSRFMGINQKAVWNTLLSQIWTLS